MSKFSEKVKLVINNVPSGKVVSYGQVALYVGVPRAARQVGWILRQSKEGDTPWWRVINNEGRISIKGHHYNTPDLQRKLLQSEKIFVNDSLEVEIEEYRYRPSKEELRKFSLDEDYIDMVLQKIPPGND